jgi:hypothetical protein
MLYDFQLFGLQVFAPIDFFAENHKSFTGLNQEPRSSQKLRKIKAVLPPSHLIGRAGIYNEQFYTGCLLLGLKVDSTAIFFFSL